MLTVYPPSNVFITIGEWGGGVARLKYKWRSLCSGDGAHGSALHDFPWQCIYEFCGISVTKI